MDKRLQAIVRHKKWIYFTLLAVFAWGMAAHGYAFFDNSISHDSLREFHAQILGNEIKMGSGRIFTPFYRDLLGSDVTMPWFGGVLALFWIGLSVFLTIQIFDVRSKITAFLIAGIFSTNISISATVATYIHDLDSYMFSLFCAVAAVYLWKQQRRGWLCGSILVALSLGIYQSFLFVSVTLVMINCIFQLFDERTFRDVFVQGLQAVVMILLGGVLYYLAMKGALWLSDTELVKGDYNSLDLITHLTPATIIRLVGSAYADCFQRLYHAYSSYPAAMVKGITVLFFGNLHHWRGVCSL